jgi:hypothetical protein
MYYPNGMRTMLSNDSGRSYDVFISYSHADQEWVWKWLVPYLKQAGLTVCTDRESFDVGVPALVNMENAVANSRHTVLVLTPDWVKSQWTQFEALLVQQEDPAGLLRRTLPILHRPCNLPPRIALLTYADLSGEEDESAEFGKLLDAIRDIRRLPDTGKSQAIQIPDEGAGTLTAPKKRIGGGLTELLAQKGLPPDMPLYEKMANLIMISLGQASQSFFAFVMHLLALLILSVLFAWWLVQSEQKWISEPWQFGAIFWLGLITLPLLAGMLPQQREEELLTDLTNRQRIALWLDKIFGIYVSAYLGIMTVILALLGLNYLGLWSNLPSTGKVIFWLVAEWFIFTLSFVGAVIATKYWENLLDKGKPADVGRGHFLLALGFPLIVYPVVIAFAVFTLPLWQKPIAGCLIIASAFLILARKIKRQA